MPVGRHRPHCARFIRSANHRCSSTTRRVVAESAVILEYVLDRYGGGRLRPAPGGDDFERYRYFMHYAEGSAMPPVVMKLVFETMPRQPMPFFVRPLVAKVAATALKMFVDPEVRRHVEYLESELATRPWFCGVRVYRGRRANEFSGRGHAVAIGRGVRRELPARARVFDAYSRASGVSTSSGAGWTVRPAQVTKCEVLFARMEMARASDRGDGPVLSQRSRGVRSRA